VGAHVHLQIGRCQTPTVATSASVRFFARVRFHVHRELTFNRETFITYGTLKRLLPGMSPDVFTQMRRVIKTLFAVFTFKRFLARMGAHVYP
jgi:molybdopterin converting factor small subunit